MKINKNTTNNEKNIKNSFYDCINILYLLQ